MTPLVTELSRRVIKTIDQEPQLFDVIDLNLIFSPTHRYILNIAKTLYDHKQPCSLPYLKEAIKRNSKQPDRLISEIEEIHTHDYWIGGAEINEWLREEYNKNVVHGVQRILNNDELEDTQKMKKIDSLISGSEMESHAVELDDLIGKIVSFAKDPSSGEVLRRYKITNTNLTQIFGEYIYASPYIIAGRPGDFKTSLMLEVANHLTELGLHGYHFSLEDSKEMTAVKLAAIRNDIEKTDILGNKIADKKLELMQLNKHSGRYFINDKMIDKDDFRRMLKAHKKNNHLDFITLDYVQLLRMGKMSRYESLTEFSHLVMSVCKEFQIPVIMTAQTKREYEGSRPNLGCLKECGSLEQDTRYLYALWNENGNDNNEKRHLAIIKDSTNGTGDRTLMFEGKTGAIHGVYEFSGLSKKTKAWA